MAGLGSFRGQTVAFVGHQKGRDLKERTHRNFGMPRPEGYRKAMRAFELAGRLGFPVVTLIDTPGAYPGVGAEQRGQSGAIARSQLLLMGLQVPVVACVIGEGSSGGALAIAVADRVLSASSTRILHGDLTGGLRGHPVEGRGRGEAGCECAFGPPPTPVWRWAWWMRSCRSRAAAPIATTARRPSCWATPLPPKLQFLSTLPAVERRRLRRQKFERMGSFVE